MPPRPWGAHMGHWVEEREGFGNDMAHPGPTLLDSMSTSK